MGADDPTTRRSFLKGMAALSALSGLGEPLTAETGPIQSGPNPLGPTESVPMESTVTDNTAEKFNGIQMGPDTLLDDGRRALLSFQKGEGYDIRKAGWTVAMRPLRASNERCVQCHVAGGAESKLKIGDALGAAMYVYR